MCHCFVFKLKTLNHEWSGCSSMMQVFFHKRNDHSRTTAAWHGMTNPWCEAVAEMHLILAYGGLTLTQEMLILFIKKQRLG